MSPSWRWRLGAGVGCALGWVLRACSDVSLTRLAEGVGGGLWWVLSRRRQLSCEHVGLALPELSEGERRRVARGAWTHVVLTGLMALRRAGGGGGVCVVSPEDLSRLKGLLEEGRGLLLVSGHLGDFEGLLTLHEQLERPVWLLSRRFSSELAQGLWDASRVWAPPRLDGGERARWVIGRLRAGEVVVDVIDQHDPRPSALWLPFFGVNASVSSDMGRLAFLTGAPVVPIFCVRGELPRGRGEGLTARVVVGEVRRIEGGRGRAEAIEGVVRGCVEALEVEVRRAPEQWLWLHRRWKGRPGRLRGGGS
jgi:KDO2-lipid IV(A) lauroyltransferase